MGMELKQSELRNSGDNSQNGGTKYHSNNLTFGLNSMVKRSLRTLLL